MTDAKTEVKGCGVHTIADLMGRCRVDDETGCWEWAEGRDGGGRPSLWLPALQKRTSLGVAICVLKTGKAPKKGVVWHCTCTTRDCANPDHRRAGNRKTQMLAANLQRDPLTRARISKARRAVSKLTDMDCEAIRGSDEKLRVLAQRYGVSLGHVQQVRVGKRRPALLVGASIFNLAGRL